MKNKRFRIPIIGLICCMLLGTIAFAVNGRKSLQPTAALPFI